MSPGYGWPLDDDHPDGPLPLTTTWAGAGAALVGDPLWWRTHWQLRMQPGAPEPDDPAGDDAEA